MNLRRNYETRKRQIEHLKARMNAAIETAERRKSFAPVRNFLETLFDFDYYVLSAAERKKIKKLMEKEAGKYNHGQWK